MALSCVLRGRGGDAGNVGAREPSPESPKRPGHDHTLWDPACQPVVMSRPRQIPLASWPLCWREVALRGPWLNPGGTQRDHRG